MVKLLENTEDFALAYRCIQAVADGNLTGFAAQEPRDVMEARQSETGWCEVFCSLLGSLELAQAMGRRVPLIPRTKGANV